MTIKQNILLVGCGRMGSALLAQWKQNPNIAVYVLDPSMETAFHTINDLPLSTFDIVVLAVKPQVMDDVVTSLASDITASLYISIAAGKTLESLEKLLPPSQAILRTMPNTPAMVNKGMTVACANTNVTPEQMNAARDLFERVGQFDLVQDERLMDQVTAVSGSGPAYVFLLIEELAQAGVQAGLPADLAMTLARQTVIGAASLCDASPDISAETLRQNVTSPNGTTAAALDVLMAPHGLRPLMEKAIAAATKRSRELS